jgi:hypothetical protein
MKGIILQVYHCPVDVWDNCSASCMLTSEPVMTCSMSLSTGSSPNSSVMGCRHIMSEILMLMTILVCCFGLLCKHMPSVLVQVTASVFVKH